MPSSSVEHILIEGDSFNIVAVVEFTIEEASGDGWNEPKVPAHPHIDRVTLVKTGTRRQYERFPEHRIVSVKYREIIPGDAPAWVYDALHDNAYLHDEMMEANEPDWDSMPGGRDYENDLRMMGEG